MKNYIYLFVGQGSQFVGMGHYLMNVPAIKTTFDEANDSLGYNLTQLMLEGPEDQLKQTQFAQPAILTICIAIARYLKLLGIRPIMMAGHSLGEYGCLVESEVISFSDAVRLVEKRGQFMQEAVQLGVGTMSAILGLEDEELIKSVCHEISADGDLVEPANYNCPGQVVISGTVLGVEKASEVLKGKGAKRCIPLQVSAPFHCSLLKPAGEKLKIELEKLSIKNPLIPYVSNVDAQVVSDASQIIEKLSNQVWKPVLWSTTLQGLAQKYTDGSVVEIGPSKIVSGHFKKISSTHSVFTTDTLENIDKIL